MCLQAQRVALVTMSKILRHGHSHCMSPEVQRGRLVALVNSVLMHTAHSGVATQPQWRAWCCRVLLDAAHVDDACCARVRC